MTIALVVSLLLLVIGSALLALGPYPWDGGLLVALGFVGALIVLIRAYYRPSTSAPRKRLRSRLRALQPHHGMSLGSLALSAAVGLAARSDPAGIDYTPLLLAWLAAVGIFGLGLGWPLRARFRPPGLSPRVMRVLGLLLLVALAARAVALGRMPGNFGGDEGTQVLRGLRLVERPLGNPFATDWYSVPTLSFVAYGYAMRLFGGTVAGARTLSALVGTLTVLTTFLLGRAVGGKRVGWVAGAVVAFSSYHVHFSRLASNQIFDPLVGTLAFWFLWRALQRPAADAVGRWEWGWAGVVAGFGWYLYFGARWVALLAGLVILWRMVVEPRFLPRHGKGLLTMVAGGLVVTLPLLAWYGAHPDALVSRYNAVSIFASGWLRSAMGVTGKGAWALLLEQFWKSVSAFHLTPDPTFWYGPEMPLLDFFAGALMLVGLGAAFLRWRWPSRALTLIWFWSTLVMAWVLTENPPSSQRGLLLVPAVALLVAWGVEALFFVVRDAQAARLLTTSLLVASAIFNLGFYALVYTPQARYGNPTARSATQVARFVQANPLPGSTLYLLGAPYLYWEFGTLAFMLRDRTGVDVAAGALPDDVRPPARFVLVPERSEELAALMEAYPGGRVTRLRGEEGRLLATVYDWAP